MEMFRKQGKRFAEPKLDQGPVLVNNKNSGAEQMSRLDDALRFHQTALDLRSQRQALIASNIANADTPNYKARDIDFGSALHGALAGRIAPLALSTTAASHVAAAGVATAPNLQYRPETQSSVDGNTVDMDVERAAMAENTLHYEASISFINGLLKSMQAAITGQG
jgi:flagellar basal-body rod protein FlgB